MSDSDDPGAETIHASCVAIEGRGVLITGPSGAGKSSLALQLIALGAELVADDRARLSMRGEAVVASSPPRLSGLIEARGVGLMRFRAQSVAEVVLVADLSGEKVDRLPRRSVRRLLRSATPLISVEPNAVGASVIVALLRGAELIDPDADGLRT